MKAFTWILVLAAACASNESSLRASRTGAMEHEMTNCPSSVSGANTVVGLTSDGVDVTVTAVAPEAQRRIQELADLHTRMGQPGNAVMHTGQHGGPGMMGHCPIIHHDTIVTATKVVDGAVFHIRATESAQVDAIQREVRARVGSMQARAESQ